MGVSPASSSTGRDLCSSSPTGQCPSWLCTFPPGASSPAPLSGPRVETELINHPQGRIPPCLPSPGTGSSLNWRWGEQPRPISPRRSLCRFPPLLLSSAINFAFCSPLPFLRCLLPRRCLYMRLRAPGRRCHRCQSMAKSLSHAATISSSREGCWDLISFSCPLFPALPGTFSSLRACSHPSGHVLISLATFSLF